MSADMIWFSTDSRHFWGMISVHTVLLYPVAFVMAVSQKNPPQITYSLLILKCGLFSADRGSVEPLFRPI